MSAFLTYLLYIQAQPPPRAKKKKQPYRSLMGHHSSCPGSENTEQTQPRYYVNEGMLPLTFKIICECGRGGGSSSVCKFWVDQKTAAG